MSSHAVNISSPERVARVVLGTASVLVGLAILGAGPAVVGALGALLLVALGVDFVYTGATGYCPLYAKLGHVPRSLRGAHR